MSSPSKEFQDIAAFFPTDFNTPDDDYLTVRAKMKPFHGHPVQADTEVAYTQAGDRQMAWVQAGACTRPDRVALFCHGGGFVSCPMEDYLFFAELASAQLNCRVALPDYRLAPEYPFPAALDDCTEAYRTILESGVTPEQLFTTGDSCGGGIALAVLLKARDEGLPMPACHVGFTGWYDLALDPSVTDQDPRAEPLITPGWYRARVSDYLGDASADQPYASPACGDGEGLPPLLLQMGENDLCLPGARKVAQNFHQADVQVQVSDGMVHGFHGLVSSGVPESIAAWKSARAFVDQHLPAS